MDVRFLTVVVVLMGALAACGGTTPARTFVDPNRMALVVAVDPRVVIPPAMTSPTPLPAGTAAVDIGRIFGEAVLYAFTRDPRLKLSSAPPSNRMSLAVREYGFRMTDGGGAQLTLSVAADLFDPAGTKIWSRAITRAYDKAGMEAELADPARLARSLRAVADDVASRLRGELMVQLHQFVRQPGTVTVPLGSKLSSAPVAMPPPAAPPPPTAPPIPQQSAPIASTEPAPIASTQPIAPPPAAPAPPPMAAPVPPPAPALPPAPKAKPGDNRAMVAREGVGLRKQPQRHLPTMQTLPTGTVLSLSSRLENEYGIWWYATSGAGKGWILESDVSMQ